MHLIVAQQLGGGKRHNYPTKTRQVGRTKEQSMYSLMSMFPALYREREGNTKCCIVHWLHQSIHPGAHTIKLFTAVNNSYRNKLVVTIALV